MSTTHPEPSSPRLRSAIEIASSGPVVRRGILYFLIVGSILILLNHGDALMRGDIDGLRLIKIMLTPCVPYLVSTFSSVSAIQAAEKVALEASQSA